MLTLTRKVRDTIGLPSSPFVEGERRLIVHGNYHRGGTVWFKEILTRIASRYSLKFRSCTQEELQPETDIFQQYHSEIDLDRLPAFVGSHMIRDPRDIIVSGFFYHQWTEESWARQPRAEYGGKSYQEHLNSLDKHEGLLAEISLRSDAILAMTEWNYNDPRIIELKYEEVIADEQRKFREIFEHYGFHSSAVHKSLRIVKKCSFRYKTGREIGESQEGEHLRSGRAGQWQDHFKAEHKQLFKELTGDTVVQLGYETSNDW